MRNVRGFIFVAAVALATCQAQGAVRHVHVTKNSASEYDRQGKPSTNGDIDWPMYRDPLLPRSRIIRTFHPRLVPVLLLALGRNDVETIRHAADDISRARGVGMPGLEAAVAPLTELLEHQHAVARRSAAGALISLDARSASDALLRRNRNIEIPGAQEQDGLDMTLLTDAALASWDYEPAYAFWMQRLNDPDTPPISLLGAMDALRIVRHPDAAERLRSILLDHERDPAMRLTAATALGAVQTSGSESVAERMGNGSIIDRLVAACLLAEHSGDKAIALMKPLARDPEPTVAAIALRRLLDIDPLLIEPLGAALLTNNDPRVRMLAAEGVFAQKTSVAIRNLAPLLNDIYPPLREYVRRRLIAQDRLAHLTQAVRQRTTEQLEGKDWKGLEEGDRAALVKSQWRRLEQAAIVLGALDHEPAADRLLELLEYPRIEVRVAAAVALRRLAITGTLAPMLHYAWRAANWQRRPEETPRLQFTLPAAAHGDLGRGVVSPALRKAFANNQVSLSDDASASREAEGEWRITDGDQQYAIITENQELKVYDLHVGKGMDSKFDLDVQMAQLIQAFAEMDYGPAESLMRVHVPKTVPASRRFGGEARSAAIWGLGRLLEDRPDEALARKLVSRLSDYSIVDPEDQRVQRMSAITLGRMRADYPFAISALRKYQDQMASSVAIGGSTRWALMRITGEDIPEYGPHRQLQSHFSLRPTEKLSDDELLDEIGSP